MKRILIAVTHLLGSGHLVRARHLAQALASAGYAVTLASGGMPLRGRDDDAFAFVQLPPVKTVGVDFRTLLDEAGAPVGPGHMTARVERLARLAAELRPDVVVTEHFPFGRRQLAGEFLGLIGAVKTVNPEAIVLSSIRDVLVTPRPDRIAEAEMRIATHVDGVLVHGDSGFLPLDASWPVSEALRAKLHYTGYLTGPPEPARHPTDPSAAGRGEIVVSGGGSAAALPLFAACIAASRLLGPQRGWRLLVGRGAPADAVAALTASAPDHVTVEWARPDFPQLLAACALSISQSGYNTVLDLLSARVPAIVVPFEEGAETEQALRAEAMERAGLARCLRSRPGAALSPALLAQAVEAALSAGPPAPAGIDRDGARGSVAVIGRLLAHRG